jgi:hypothetical protein
MKYRIKIITFKNGRKLFYAQVKPRFIWLGLDYDGAADCAFSGECETRECALNRIDKHFEGNAKIQKIEFEYINK